jgi:hypothetical protein
VGLWFILCSLAGSKVYRCGFCGAAAENSTMDDKDDGFSENILNTTGIIKQFATPNIFAWDNHPYVERLNQPPR